MFKAIFVATLFLTLNLSAGQEDDELPVAQTLACKDC